MSVYRAAVVGLGKKGFLWDVEDSKREKPYTHVGAYITCPRTHLSAVYDPSPEAMKRFFTIDFSKEFEGKAHDIGGYNDFQDLMNKEKPEIISIASPTDTHCKLVCTAARYASVKAIFCEKPIASTVEEAEKMIRVCKSFSVKLAVNHTRRWEPLWQEAHELTMSMGSKKRLIGYCSGDPLEAGIHMADAFLWFGGDESDIYVNLMTEQPYKPYLVFELDAFYEKGRVTVSDNGRKISWWIPGESENYDGFMELGVYVVRHKADLPRSYEGTAMSFAVQNLVDACDGSRELLCTGEDGIAALEVCQRWLKQ